MELLEMELKKFILNRYKSVSEFTKLAEMPHSTFDTILNRGINKSSIANVIKICDTLNISMGELAMGKIVDMSPQDSANSEMVDIYLEFAKEAKKNLIHPDDIRCAIDIIKKLRSEK